jgi:dienelactone hydrolase
VIPTRRYAKFVGLSLLASVFAGSASPVICAAAESDSAHTRTFDYERAADFAVEEKASESRGDVVVRDLTFFTVPAEKLRRVAAYLVAPRSIPPRAAILWIHWLGDAATTNRTEFLDEAVSLASHGILSLLIDGMWSKRRWYGERVLAEDHKDGIAQVAALRRSLDFLQQQPGAATIPLGIVGHDYGGMYAIVAAAQESRAKTCVFIACTSSLLEWAFFKEKPASMETYVQQNAPLDLRRHAAAIQGASIFFQFAERDKYVPLAKAQELFAAAPLPKQMTIYGGADHNMRTPAAIQFDRTAWLLRELRQ